MSFSRVSAGLVRRSPRTGLRRRLAAPPIGSTVHSGKATFYDSAGAAVVNPPVSGPLTFRMKDGASQWWFAVQVGNHGNPLRSVEAKGPGGSFRAAARQDYNYWIIEGGLGAGPYSIRVTDVYGRQTTATNIRMAPKQVQRSTVSLSGAGAPAGAARTPSRSPSARPTPTVSAAPTATTPAPSPTPAATLEALAGTDPVDSSCC